MRTLPGVIALGAALVAGCGGPVRGPGIAHPVTSRSTSALATQTAVAEEPVAQQGSLAWHTGPTMPTALSEVGVAATGTTIHVLGGYVHGIAHSTTHLEFDTLTQAWSLGTPLPQRLDHVGAAAVGNRLFAIGGYGTSGVATTGVYELVHNTWVARTPLPLARAAAVTVVLNGKIHVIGGRTPNGGDTDRQDIYDPVSDTWSEAAPIPLPRDHAAGAVVNGRIYRRRRPAGLAVQRGRLRPVDRPLDDPPDAADPAQLDRRSRLRERLRRHRRGERG